MQDDAKKKAAERAVEFVGDGQIVGLGTGSTSRFAIEAIARSVAGGLRIRGVATSIGTEKLAESLGIPIAALNDVEAIDVVIDGADEIDGNFDMIKGGGGALTREKLVALASKRRVYIVDESKVVTRLGDRWPVPVEVLPFSWQHALRRISELGCKPALREKDGGPFETDNGNYILDCHFEGISNPAETEKRVKLIPGVLECGLFISIADVLVIGRPDGVEVRDRPGRARE